jgi:hypothetical protein
MVLTLSDQMIERFWSLVDRRGGPDACWLWTGPTRSRGAGWFNTGSRQLDPHRIAFDLSGATVPAGLMLYRTCRNPRCCNPKHVQPMTKTELARVRSQR